MHGTPLSDHDYAIPFSLAYMYSILFTPCTQTYCDSFAVFEVYRQLAVSITSFVTPPPPP